MSAARVIALFVAGLFVGTLCSFMIANALQQRHAVAKSTMTLMQYHLSQARKNARSNACDGPAAPKHVTRLRALAEDATPIFEQTGYANANFERRRQGFLTEVDRGIAAGADCAGIGSALKPIADACASCHHETR